MTTITTELANGRNCPLSYRYKSAELAACPTTPASTLYIIGGLYGNPFALVAIETMLASETQPVTLCFNGDFNWFNYAPDDFANINQRVAMHDAIQGNVEAELASADNSAGCGCSYPEEVAEHFVERSNRIHQHLQKTAQKTNWPAFFSTLPMFRRYLVGDVRLGVVHGDAQSLAGWDFAVVKLRHEAHRQAQLKHFQAAEVDVFASSHTCQPVLANIHRDKWLINNGAAGIPNFDGDLRGLISRISSQPSPHKTLYGCRIGDVYIDALAVPYDVIAWQQHFLHHWPQNSDAWLSYYQRICGDCDYSQEDAIIARVPQNTSTAPLAAQET